MSNQYARQPYGQPHPAQPYGGPGYPPPKKKMGAGKIIAIVLGSIFGFFVLLVVLGLAIGDDSNHADGKDSILEVTASPTPTPAAVEPAERAPEKAPEKAEPAEKKPESKKGREYPSGDYVVGEDIPAGTYTSAGAEKGVFEFCSITTEPTGDLTMPKIKTANADERIIITLEKADGVVSVSNCEPLKRR